MGQDTATIGLALAVIGLLVRSLVDALKTRSESAVHSAIHRDVQELVRMHRDGMSIFSNVQVLETLHDMKTDIAVIKAKDCVSSPREN